jgi:hypothetical protein
MYQRFGHSLSSAPKRDPEISSDFDVDGPLLEKQEMGPTPEPQASYTWLPPALRGLYLRCLFVVSLLLSGTVFYFTRKSAIHHGICDNKDSAAIFFSWRFLPTLVAMMYSLLIADLANDVRRTEILARLSSPNGASAAHTICMPTRSWRKDPFDAWNKRKNNGKRSWALLSASIANLLALLIISPLSTNFVSPVDTRFATPITLLRARELGEMTELSTASPMVTSLTTIGAVLNLTTSAWLTTKYTVVPFWSGTSISPL